MKKKTFDDWWVLKKLLKQKFKNPNSGPIFLYKKTESHSHSWSTPLIALVKLSTLTTYTNGEASRSHENSLLLHHLPLHRRLFHFWICKFTLQSLFTDLLHYIKRIDVMRSSLTSSDHSVLEGSGLCVHGLCSNRIDRESRDRFEHYIDSIRRRWLWYQDQ